MLAAYICITLYRALLFLLIKEEPCIYVSEFASATSPATEGLNSVPGLVAPSGSSLHIWPCQSVGNLVVQSKLAGLTNQKV